MPIQLTPGGSFGATLSFNHSGGAITVWIGIGLAYGLFTGHATPFVYAMKQFAVPADASDTHYTADVSGVVPTNVEGGKLLDAQRFISKTQPTVGQQPPNDFGVNNWDDDEPYSTMAGAAFSSLLASYW